MKYSNTILTDNNFDEELEKLCNKVNINHTEYKSFEEEVRELNFDMPTEPYNVVLFHSPINIYNFIRNHPRHNLNKANLILSGHMHNGCLPSWIARFINKTFKSSRGLISPNIWLSKVR